jgi:hypothetical protein
MQAQTMRASGVRILDLLDAERHYPAKVSGSGKGHDPAKLFADSIPSGIVGAMVRLPPFHQDQLCDGLTPSRPWLSDMNLPYYERVRETTAIGQISQHLTIGLRSPATGILSRIALSQRFVKAGAAFEISGSRAFRR